MAVRHDVGAILEKRFEIKQLEFWARAVVAFYAIRFTGKNEPELHRRHFILHDPHLAVLRSRAVAGFATDVLNESALLVMTGGVASHAFAFGFLFGRQDRGRTSVGRRLPGFEDIHVAHAALFRSDNLRAGRSQGIRCRENGRYDHVFPRTALPEEHKSQ
jgi:hypothetical protein